MKTILLIDLSSLFRTLWHANADGAVSVAYQGTLDGVRRCQSLYPGADVAVCCDGRGNWRKDLSKEYKAQRETAPAQMYGQLDRVKSRLKQDGYLLWECPGFEADDIIATAAESFSVRPDHEVVICSADKDLFQLLCTNIRQLRTNTWQEITADTVREKSGIGPHQFADMLALTGDKSDNVKGCDGVGEKTAAGLLAEIGGLAAIFDRAINDPVDEPFWLTAAGKPGALRPKLIACQEQVMLARKLVSLRIDAPITPDEIFEERKVEDLVTEDASIDPAFSDDRISSGKVVGLKPEIIDALADAFPTATVTKSVAIKPDVVTTQVATPSPQVETTALATYDGSRDFDKDLQPTSMLGVKWFAVRAFNSRMYGKFASVEQQAMVIARGRDFGLSATASLELFQVIDGKICPPAQLLMAQAKRHPDCEYFAVKESSATSVTMETKRKGTPFPEVCTYTLEMAKTAKLVRPGGGYEKNPEDMLVARAGSKLARRVYPDATMGAHSYEEMTD